MIKLLKWTKKKFKCFNYGHDYYYYKYAECFFCKRCGKVTRLPLWFKEE